MSAIRHVLLLLAATATLQGCIGADGDVYTLYRASPLDGGMRIHVASFDTADGEAYNRENCTLTGKLFQAQPGVTVRYWCEKGRFRK